MLRINRNFALFSVMSALAALALLPTLSFGAEATLTDDAYVNQASPQTNYGRATILSVRSSPSQRQTFLKFDLSPLPTGTTSDMIAKASLKLFVGNVSTGGSFDVVRVTNDWNEESITYKTLPTTGAVEAEGVTLALGHEDLFVVVDLTELVKSWVDGAAPNYGIALRARTPINADFDSKEATGTSHEARLEITLLEVPAGVGVKGPIWGIIQGGTAVHWSTHPPNPRFAIYDADTPDDYSDDVVLDRETGLAWERSPSTAQWDWVAGFFLCFNKTVGGRKGWRPPTVEELASLVDPKVSGLTLPPGHPFLNVLSAIYWSSSTWAYNTDNAYYVDFANGTIYSNINKNDKLFWIWCVRGGYGHDMSSPLAQR